MPVGIGERIRELRRRSGKRQEDLARALGVTAQAVSRWETGLGYPDVELIPAVADYFGVEIGELFGRAAGRRYTASCDIGGTKIALGIADERGEILAGESFPTLTGKDGAERCAERIARTVFALAEQAGIGKREICGVGLFSAGPVDPEGGTVENPYTLPGWEGFHLAPRIRELTGLPAALDNDANGALLGEVLLRRLSGKRVLAVTLGTGVGAALYDGEKLYRAGRFHPELGHVVVTGKGERCYCGRRGCFESLASGRAMNLRAEKAGYPGFAALVAAAGKKDGAAKRLLNAILGDLWNGVWNLALVFKPEILILAGGIGREFFPVIARGAEGLFDGKEDFVPPFRILPAYEGRNPALAGAAMLYRR